MEAHFTSIQEIRTNEDAFKKIYAALHVPNPNPSLYETVKQNVSDFLGTLRDELCVVVESDYADPVYRDSYYHHYSIKLRPYAKDCVRLSFFKSDFANLNDFISKETKVIQNAYLGFLVLRPLSQCIGRNAIDVRAKKDHLGEIEICKSTIKATCLGHKLSVKGFPHSSQDGEYMSCAENSIWTMLEYFGNKYTVYDPILPSQIVQTLKDYKHDRLIPTTGLSYSHISMLLKKRGFETKVYHKDDVQFQELFACYIESGLPLIVCIQGKNFGGHAVVCVGRKIYDYTQFTHFDDEFEIEGKSKQLCYWNRHIDTFVVNDDNFPAYRMIDFGDPVNGYPEADDASITSFIVPMHEEIFLPAEKAIALSNIFIADLPMVNHCCLRTFLTTSRSYKEYIINNKDLSVENKQELIQLDLPKFVWVTEFVDVAQNSTECINGMLAIDATSNTQDSVYEKSLIFLICQNVCVYYDNHDGQIVNTTSIFPPLFERFKGNLK